MATIKENYVSLEIAKLLKEKGFYQASDKYYNKKGRLSTFEPDFLEEEWWPAYTLQTAMKWLREMHYLNIEIRTASDHFEAFVLTIEEIPTCKVRGIVSKTYEEACEAAIKYCLENLI